MNLEPCIAEEKCVFVKERKSRITNCKIEDRQITLKTNIFSLFYVSLLDYEGRDNEVSKKGWLEPNNEHGNNSSMIDVFRTKYAFFLVGIIFSQVFFIVIILKYSLHSLVYLMGECVKTQAAEAYKEEWQNSPIFILVT